MWANFMEWDVFVVDATLLGNIFVEFVMSATCFNNNLYFFSSVTYR